MPPFPLTVSLVTVTLPPSHQTAEQGHPPLCHLPSVASQTDSSVTNTSPPFSPSSSRGFTRWTQGLGGPPRAQRQPRGWCNLHPGPARSPCRDGAPLLWGMKPHRGGFSLQHGHLPSTANKKEGLGFGVCWGGWVGIVPVGPLGWTAAPLDTRVPLPSSTGDLDAAVGLALIFNALLASTGLIGGDWKVPGGTQCHGDGHRPKCSPWKRPQLKQGQAGK